MGRKKHVPKIRQKVPFAGITLRKATALMAINVNLPMGLRNSNVMWMKTPIKQSHAILFGKKDIVHMDSAVIFPTPKLKKMLLSPDKSG